MRSAGANSRRSAATAGARLSGEVVARLEAPGLRLTEHVYPDGLRLERHAHDRAFLTLVLSGDYRETIGNTQQRCLPHSVRFLPAGETHIDDYRQGGARCLHVEIAGSTLDRLREFDCAPPPSGEWHSAALRALAQRLAAQFHNSDGPAALAVEGLILEILAEAGRPRTFSPPSATLPSWLGSARDFLHASFTESVALDDVAATSGVHVVHLCREFRRYFHCTVGDYIRRLRVEHACVLLSASQPPLAEVALTCGFSDQSHFTRTFRRYMGITPAQFRTLQLASSVGTTPGRHGALHRDANCRANRRHANCDPAVANCGQDRVAGHLKF